MYKLRRAILVLMNIFGGFYLLTTIGLMEHFQEISTIRILVCTFIMIFYFLEIKILEELGV